ncbi:SHOCT domain-containing protein, partial [Silanimonas sp.]|uniref:SHOCT domain-containing protein n=1 Tax=Silanimonas sp. TaxID=1929290 RepID=UPI0022C5B84A
LGAAPKVRKEFQVFALNALIILTFLVVIPVLIGLAIWWAVRANTGPTARLAKLDQLRDSGTITPAEYERQRASIISGV